MQTNLSAFTQGQFCHLWNFTLDRCGLYSRRQVVQGKWKAIFRWKLYSSAWEETLIIANFLCPNNHTFNSYTTISNMGPLNLQCELKAPILLHLYCNDKFSIYNCKQSFTARQGSESSGSLLNLPNCLGFYSKPQSIEMFSFCYNDSTKYWPPKHIIP